MTFCSCQRGVIVFFNHQALQCRNGDLLALVTNLLLKGSNTIHTTKHEIGLPSPLLREQEGQVI